MKKILFFSFVLLALVGCKEHDWMDWKVQNQTWLMANAQRDSVHTTPTGLQYKVIRQGVPGVKPDNDKTVVVDYYGSLITGNIFDAGFNTSLPVNNVVKGFAEGLKKMNKSGHYILYIPAELGYGAEGHGTPGDGSYIPPYSTLVFDVTLLDTYY